jgi:hypothetical protein
MPVGGRQVALLLAVAAGAFALALTLGRATRASTAALPAAPAAQKVSISDAGQAVAIPTLKAPPRSAPAGVTGGGAQPTAPTVTAQPRPSPTSTPAQKSPRVPPGAGDVTVSG